MGTLGCRQERPALTNSLSPGLTNAIGSLGDLGPRGARATAEQVTLLHTRSGCTTCNGTWQPLAGPRRKMLRVYRLDRHGVWTLMLSGTKLSFQVLMQPWLIFQLSSKEACPPKQLFSQLPASGLCFEHCKIELKKRSLFLSL